MALQTATGCKEKYEKRFFCPVERIDEAGRSRLPGHCDLVYEGMT